MWGLRNSATAGGPSIVQALAPGTVLSKVRIPELDGIRGLAILSVLAYHLLAYSMQLWAMRNGTPWPTIPNLVRLITWPGFLGVDVFFVLSGFLITGILLDTKDEPGFLKNFYMRRVLRILPLYFVVLAVIAIAYSNSGKFILLSVFFLSNLAVLYAPIVAPAPLWSLSIEEHFYLVWPWVVKAVSRQTLMIIAFLICAIEPLVRVAGFPVWGDGYFFSWTRFDGLAWGALVACFARSPAATRRMASRLSWICTTVAVIVLLAGVPFGLLSRQNLVGVALQYTPAQFFSMALILSAFGIRDHGINSLMRAGIMRLFGDLSYCLYMIHMLVMDGYDSLMSWLWPTQELALGAFATLAVRAITVLVFSVGLALLSRRFLELPALRLKRYLDRRSPRAVAAIETRKSG